MNYKFRMVDDFLNSYIKRNIKQESNIFLKLNETDYYEENKFGTLCHYQKCEKEAIGSHTYPKSFLKKIANGNNVYSTDIKHVVGNSYEKGISDLVKETNIKYAGVQPLFCSKHDTEVFKTIELPNQWTNLETYLSLFLYRAYIYDFQLESEIHNPRVDRKINIDKAYSRKINKKDEIEYLLKQEISTKIIGQNSSFHNYDVLKQKFDEIFIENESPQYADFCKHFILKYYDLGFLPEFFASGTMFFSTDFERGEAPLQSIYAIIPDKSLKTAYFCILIPNESKFSMEPIIESLEMEYKNANKENFFKIIEFLLLDATQNIIMTESLYNKLKVNGDYSKLIKICISLVMARLPIAQRFPSSVFRDYSYFLLSTIKLINND